MKWAIRLKREKESSGAGNASDGFWSFFYHLDYLQMIVMTLLLGVGMLFIYSTGVQAGSEFALGFWKKQLVWIVLGYAGYFFLAALDYRKLIPWSWFIYAGCILLLVLVLLVGKVVNGARSWIDLGVIQLQPSEFAKLSVILFLAALHANPLFYISRIRHLLLTVLVLFTPIALILLEPDFGSAAVLVPVGVAMIFVAGVKRRYFLVVGAVVVVGLGLLTANEVFQIKPILKNYQRERILTFLNPERDLAHRGYNAYQSRLAVGSGGLTGKGVGEGTQNLLGFLPQSVSNNDFIFSVLAEESGFVGAVTLLLGYALLLYTILRTAFLSRESFGQYFALGFGVLLFVHLFINIGMSVGVTPITGLPLPLLSYGGSFVLSVMLGLGILQSIYRIQQTPEH